jgi:hypothetical protein
LRQRSHRRQPLTAGSAEIVVEPAVEIASPRPHRIGGAWATGGHGGSVVRQAGGE